MQNAFLPRWMRQGLGGLLMVLMFLLIWNQLFSHDRMPPQTFSVSGEGKVTLVPDVAIVTLGVVSQGANPFDVKNENNKKINQILKFIKSESIPDSDIKTSEYNSSPQYNYINGQNSLVGYQANQTITIKVKNIDRSRAELEKILDESVNQGANEVRNIYFDVEDKEAAQQQARKLAVKKAKEKAKLLSSAAGLHLGRVINILESGENPAFPSPVMAMANLRNKSVAPTIEPGNQDVVETIVLVFEVKP